MYTRKNTKAELQAALREKGLPSTGKKDDLLRRLRNIIHDSFQELQNQTTNGTAYFDLESTRQSTVPDQEAHEQHSEFIQPVSPKIIVVNRTDNIVESLSDEETVPHRPSNFAKKTVEKPPPKNPRTTFESSQNAPMQQHLSRHTTVKPPRQPNNPPVFETQRPSEAPMQQRPSRKVTVERPQNYQRNLESQLTMVDATVSSKEDMMSLQIQRLQQQVHLMERERNLLERERALNNVSAADRRPKSFTVREIAEMLPEFDPADKTNGCATKFIRRVRDLQDVYKWEERLLVFAAQSKLRGFARTWSDSNPQVFRYFDEFAEMLIIDFPSRVNEAQVHVEMINTIRPQNEDAHNYCYRMCALGRRGG